MQETVQYQLKIRGETLKIGDVLLSNHPQAGNAQRIAHRNHFGIIDFFLHFINDYFKVDHIYQI